MSKNNNSMKNQNNRSEMKNQNNKAQMNKPSEQIADVPNPPVPNRARTPLSSTDNQKCETKNKKNN